MLNLLDIFDYHVSSYPDIVIEVLKFMPVDERGRDRVSLINIDIN